MTRRGFTLFEVLVAVAMLVALVSTMSAFLHDLLTTRTRLLESSGAQRAAASLIERLEGDLATCIAGDVEHGAGVAGDETSLRILTRTVPVSLAERGAEAPEIFADLERATYRFDPRGGRIETRREVLHDAAPRTRFESFGAPVGRVRFRYHDGSGWRARFDSTRAGGLPRAIEVAVWIDRPPADDDLFDGDDALDEPLEDALDEDPFEPLDALDDEEETPEPLDDAAGEPLPDRIRIIVIPDSESGTESESEPESGPDSEPEP